MNKKEWEESIEYAIHKLNTEANKAAFRFRVISSAVREMQFSGVVSCPEFIELNYPRVTWNSDKGGKAATICYSRLDKTVTLEALYDENNRMVTRMETVKPFGDIPTWFSDFVKEMESQDQKEKKNEIS